MISAGPGNLDQTIAVVGAGGHAKVVIATLQAGGHRILEAYDDDPLKVGKAILGVVVLGLVASLKERSHIQSILAIGDNSARQRLASELCGLNWIHAAHPNAAVHDSVQIAPGALVFAGAVVQPDASIGFHAIVNTGALVDHDCVIGDFAHLGPGSVLVGQVTIGEGSLIGAGAVIGPGLRVGDWAVVGAGAVVIRDVPAGITVAGNPARVL